MSLRDALVGAVADDLIRDKAPGWIDKAIVRARIELPKVTAEANARLAPFGVEVSEAAAGRVLAKLEEGKAPLVRLGSLGLAWVTANLESGDQAEARRVYLECSATFEERRAAMQAAGDAAFDDAKERSDAWEAFASFAAELGEVGLSILIAVAKRAVGLP